MFERFTDRARRVVVLAQEEARLLNHGYIGTEHILLGILRDEESVGWTVLRSFDVSLDNARAIVRSIVGPGTEAPEGHLPFTPRAKTVLELSLRERLQFAPGPIGPEHILLGLVRERDGVAAQVLAKFGADYPSVREAIVALDRGGTFPAAVSRASSLETAALAGVPPPAGDDPPA